MSYTRKTWVDRVSEYPTRRILTDTSTGTSQQVTVQRSEGTITTNGDSFDAETMNDFEGRIASAFTTDQAAIGNLSLLETEEKDSLVEAINEVKGDIPQNVPRALGDLSNVELSTSGILNGSALVFDANDSTWKDQKLSADLVTYDDTLAKQQGYDPLISGPDVQGALESVNFYLDNHEMRIEQLKEEKVSPYQLGETINIAGTLCSFWQAGNSVRVFVPLSKPIDSAVTTSVIRQTGNFEIRMYNGTQIASGHPLSDYGTLSVVKCPGGIEFVLSNLNSTWGDTTRYTTGFAYANAGNQLKFGTASTLQTSALRTSSELTAEERQEGETV